MSVVPIPVLDSPADISKGEGTTDFKLFIEPHGTVKAVMIFVDFSDAPAGSADPASVAEVLLGQNGVQGLFKEQSYGNLGLEVTVRSDLGWRRMLSPTPCYATDDFCLHRDYTREAAAHFTGDIRFSDFQIVLVATPEGASFGAARAFTAHAGTGARFPGGEIRWAVTLDGSSLKERFTTLVHEIGHLFGLPDHYRAGGGADDSLAGSWSIMSDVFRATGFLGWHRHKNGWLAEERKTYLTPDVGQWSGTLQPLSAAQGLSMIVIPTDDPVKPTKLLVIELAQKVRGFDDHSYRGEGVLLYTVDLTRGTGFSPVEVLPKINSFSDNFGNLFEAPYLVGDRALAGAGGRDVAVEVVQRVGESYNLTVRFA